VNVPIYEYRCQKCGHEFEVMQKVNDPAPDPCPKCSAEKTMERLVSRTSFQLKGGGWYSDLYGSSKKDSTSKTEGTGTSRTSGTSSGGTGAASSSSTGSPGSSGSSGSGSSSSGGSGSSGGSSGGSGS
jgi:putative FmdB family regulatory protein